MRTLDKVLIEYFITLTRNVRVSNFALAIGLATTLIATAVSLWVIGERFEAAVCFVLGFFLGRASILCAKYRSRFSHTQWLEFNLLRGYGVRMNSILITGGFMIGCFIDPDQSTIPFLSMVLATCHLYLISCPEGNLQGR